MKYAELMVDWLVELGYTHCFFVAGGNNMHLLDGVRNRMTCVPFVHEVAAAIAVEYFNEAGGSGRAFALVTAGPGMTNTITGLAGAYLESRELLLLGGQVKSTDLADRGIRQRGIQEVDGIALAAPTCVATLQITAPISKAQFVGSVEQASAGRPGPVFIEVCLDAQGAPVEREAVEGGTREARTPVSAAVRTGVGTTGDLLRSASRPVILLGGGVSRETAAAVRDALAHLGVPVMTTWNGMDRLGSTDPIFFGRPNTWGMRYSNVLLQQSDLIIAVGTRLGLQQTGFNWQQFAPLAKIVQVDIDPSELEKGHPRVNLGVAADANDFLRELVAVGPVDVSDWIAFCTEVRGLLPLAEEANVTAPGYICPFDFVQRLSEECVADDIVIPCSSGGAFTVMMQAFNQTYGQVVITDKGLASMGYGLSGAIGAALAHPRRRTVLVEGDGGFSQNLQELATVAVNNLNLKTFIFANEGYASIRMTQRNYFGGQYLGCDTGTGLGFPHWPTLFKAFGLPAIELDPMKPFGGDFQELFEADGAAGFIVPIDPEQTYFPKITSRVTETGGMESQPLHLMSPDIEPDLAGRVLRYLH